MSDPLADIHAKLLKVDAEKFAQAVGLLHDLPHPPTRSAVLARLRPRMRKLRPHRPLTPQRLFYLPFETLLCNAGTAEDTPPHHISRAQAARAWERMQQARPKAVAKAANALPRGVRPGDKPAVEAGFSLWQEGAEILAADPDLAMIATILAVAPAVIEVRAALGEPPVSPVGPDEILPVLRALVPLERTGAERAAQVALVAASLCRHPGDMVEGLAGAHARSLRIDRNRLLAPARAYATWALGRNLERLKDEPSASLLAETAERLAGALPDSADGADPALLEQVRKLITGNLVANAGAAVAQALPPDPAQAPADAASRFAEIAPAVQAEEHLRALRRCGRVAKRLGLADEVATRLAGIRDDLRQRVDTLIAAAQAGKLTRQAATLELYGCVRLLEQAGDGDGAEVLRRDGLDRLDAALPA